MWNTLHALSCECVAYACRYGYDGVIANCTYNFGIVVSSVVGVAHCPSEEAALGCFTMQKVAPHALGSFGVNKYLCISMCIICFVWPWADGMTHSDG